MSGITTTGSTIISDLDNSPKSILLWRAIMQWLGGIGIVVMAITILPLLKVGGMQLFKMEGPDSTEKILPRTIEVATIIISTYLILTFLCGTFYWIFGMSIFDSVSHAMTTIATGGFSTHNNSFAYFNNTTILNIAIIFMIIGSFPFLVLAQSSFSNIKTVIKDHQIQLFLIILIFAVSLIYFFAKNYVDGDIFFKISTISFNTISIISGTGYVSDNFENWGNYASVLFLILMLIVYQYFQQKRK